MNIKFSASTIIFAGLLVGGLDILTAFADYYIATGNGPAGVLYYVASGAFGAEAFKGGAKMLFFGLLFHYIIAFSLTLFFFWLYSRTNLLAKNRIITAVLFGIFAWCVTTFLIIPFSKIPHTPFTSIKPWKAAKNILILIAMIGFPLSFITYNKYGKRNFTY